MDCGDGKYQLIAGLRRLEAPKVDSLADQMNLPIVNMYSAFGNHSDYFMDGIHPNNDGSQLIASTMYDAVTSMENDGIYP
jgi:lysophospholipase L1-like esterase